MKQEIISLSRRDKEVFASALRMQTQRYGVDMDSVVFSANSIISIIDEISNVENSTILEVASRWLKVSIQELKGERRTQNIVFARHFICKYLHSKRWSLKAIGKMLGDRHHTTIMNSLKSSDSMITYDKILRERYSAFSQHLDIELSVCGMLCETN